MSNPRIEERAQSFIRTNTHLLRPPLVPEIQLHLAEESLPIWRKTEEELGEMNVPPPYWAFAWAGGQAMARYVLDTPGTVKAKSVLDLGTGSGLVAIAAKLAGARQVTANDVDAYAIAACEMNAAANNVSLNLVCADLSEMRDAHDVVILADVFYDKELADRVLTAAIVALRSGARVFSGDPRRSYFPQTRFAKIADYAVPVTRELEDSEIKNAAVWEFLG